jgi:glucan 1,3-beta-glucosidase
MSRKYDTRRRLGGAELLALSDDDLRAAFHESLNTGMPGLCFSPYSADQKPGSPLSEAQIQERLNIVAPFTKWVRTFSCTDGNECIPGLAKKMGLKTLVGAWLGKDEEINEREIENLIALAREGQADVAAVGNEVLYRGDLEEEVLLDYIGRVRCALPDLPVGYVDAYYEFTDRPAVTEACSIVLANCYPFWEKCPLDYALLYVKEMHRQAVRAAKGKPVFITETGWPSAGTPHGGAEPSERHAMIYFLHAMQWAREEGIELFYFSSFDEAWKIGSEGDVGAFWGLWDTHGFLKY